MIKPKKINHRYSQVKILTLSDLFLGFLIFLSCRPRLGQFEPGCLDVHWVLRHSQEPGHPPVPRALSGPGRLAGGAEHGDDSNRQHHGQQRMGGLFGGIHKARERQHQVSTILQIKVMLNEACRDYRRRRHESLLSISRHLLATHISAEAVHTTKCAIRITRGP